MEVIYNLRNSSWRQGTRSWIPTTYTLDLLTEIDDLYEAFSKMMQMLRKMCMAKQCTTFAYQSIAYSHVESSWGSKPTCRHLHISICQKSGCKVAISNPNEEAQPSLGKEVNLGMAV